MHRLIRLLPIKVTGTIYCWCFHSCWVNQQTAEYKATSHQSLLNFPFISPPGCPFVSVSLPFQVLRNPIRINYLKPRSCCCALCYNLQKLGSVPLWLDQEATWGAQKMLKQGGKSIFCISEDTILHTKLLDDVKNRCTWHSNCLPGMESLVEWWVTWLLRRETLCILTSDYVGQGTVA